jgi:hypothetical protein
LLDDFHYQEDEQGDDYEHFILFYKQFTPILFYACVRVLALRLIESFKGASPFPSMKRRVLAKNETTQVEPVFKFEAFCTSRQNGCL